MGRRAEPHAAGGPGFEPRCRFLRGATWVWTDILSCTQPIPSAVRASGTEKIAVCNFLMWRQHHITVWVQDMYLVYSRFCPTHFPYRAPSAECPKQPPLDWKRICRLARERNYTVVSSASVYCRRESCLLSCVCYHLYVIICMLSRACRDCAVDFYVNCSSSHAFGWDGRLGRYRVVGPCMG